MKKLMILTFAILGFTGISIAQTESEGTPSPNAARGQQIQSIANSTEGGREKGKTISSAARRSGIANENAAKGIEKSGKGKERAALGAENAEAGKTRAQQMRPEGAGKGSRPNVQVPAAQPNTPVGKPNTPGGNGRRPVTPPGKPSGN